MRQMTALTATQIDALREVANIGSGSAATVLSSMTGLRIMLNVPELRIVSAGRLAASPADPNEKVVSVSLRMVGDLTGLTCLIVGMPGAAILSDVLLRRSVGETRILGELERSALCEAGNIVAGGFLNAVAACIGGLLLPSIPSLSIGHRRAVLNYLDVASCTEMFIVAETDFFVEPQEADPTMGPSGADTLRHLRGTMLLAPHPASLEVLFAALRLP